MSAFISNLFSYKGRFNRLRYLGYHFFGYLGFVLTGVVFLGIGESFAKTNSLLQFAFSMACLITFVSYFVASISFTVRRLHDLDKSGWMYLFWYIGIIIATILCIAADGTETPLLAVVGLVQLGLGLWLLFARGTTGPNRFGEDRLAA